MAFARAPWLTPSLLPLNLPHPPQDLTVEWLRSAESGEVGPAASEEGSDVRGACHGWVAVVNGTTPLSLRRKGRGQGGKGTAKKGGSDSEEGSGSSNDDGGDDGAHYVSFFAYLAAGDGHVTFQAGGATPGSHSLSGVRVRDGKPERFGLLVREGPGTRHPVRFFTHLTNKSHIRTVLAAGASAASAASSPASSPASPAPVPDSSPELLLPHHHAVGVPADDVWRVDDIVKEALVTSQARAAQSVFQVRGRMTHRMGEHDPADGRTFANLQRGPEIVPLVGMHQDARKSDAAGSAAQAPGQQHNLVVVQLVVAVPFSVELVFLEPGCVAGWAPGAAEDEGAPPPLLGAARTPPVLPAAALEAAADAWGLSGSRTSAARARLQALYKDEMCARMGLCEKEEEGAAGAAAGAAPPALHVRLARAALANLLGSITYFHGEQLVGSPYDQQDVDPTVRASVPHGLLTGVPSRSFFPRGFLWDEGFHQLVASQWDPSLSRSVVSSWLATMDKDGWIAREQILGSEARSRVPEKFQVQRPDIANPPAILFPVLALAVDGLCRRGGNATTDATATAAAMSVGADGMTTSDGTAAAVSAFCARHGRPSDGCRYACAEEGGARSASPPLGGGGGGGGGGLAETLSFLLESYPKLRAHFAWFKRTQAGERRGSYRWRGATQDHNFASGLDDYPRGVVPHPTDENVDLLAWMAFFADVLGDLATLAGDDGAATAFAKEAEEAAAALVDVHWDEEAGTFCDVGVTAVVPPPPPPKGQRQTQRPTLRHGRVCHVGYVTILPVLLRLVRADDPRLGRVLAHLRSDAHLLSPVGLRSLSAADPAFATKEDYWRGAVWINMNFLAVAALRHYASLEGPFREDAAALAADLAPRIVEGVAREYKRSGFVWENYDPNDGHGRGTHPFTGWSALVALMVADRYPI